MANYVLGLLDEILDEASVREKTFAWATGDVSAKTERRAKLPFDGNWPSRKLIVEVDEDQHRRSVPFWDKPDVLTVSGVSRGEQRAIYDRRKSQAARQNGMHVVEIPWGRRPPPDRRDRESDRRRLVSMLNAAGVEV